MYCTRPSGEQIDKKFRFAGVKAVVPTMRHCVRHLYSLKNLHCAQNPDPCVTVLAAYVHHLSLIKELLRLIVSATDAAQTLGCPE